MRIFKSQVLTAVTESEQGQRDVSIQLVNTFRNRPFFLQVAVALRSKDISVYLKNLLY
jgi:hypothetical protein